jgi:hypothetical protein
VAGRSREGCTGVAGEWRKKEVGREELASVGKEAKAVRAPYSQAVSKVK